eukprot:2009631-Rhodomonas_salina.1
MPTQHPPSVVEACAPKVLAHCTSSSGSSDFSERIPSMMSGVATPQSRITPCLTPCRDETSNSDATWLKGSRRRRKLSNVEAGQLAGVLQKLVPPNLPNVVAVATKEPEPGASAEPNRMISVEEAMVVLSKKRT